MGIRDPSAVDAEMVALLGDLSRRAGRPADEAEVRAALAPLTREHEAFLRRAARGEPPARPLGPMAWADMARGVEPEIAAARENSGYYALLAERDALASLLKARGPVEAKPAAADLARSPPAERRAERASPAERTSRAERGTPANGPAEAPSRRRAAGKVPAAAEGARNPILPPAAQDRSTAAKIELLQGPGPRRGAAEEILGLFAYHRDAPSVAKALAISMADLEAEIDRLKLRRRTARLVRGRDVDMPAAAAVPGVGHGPPVRRRARPATVGESPGTEAAAPPSAEPGPPAKSRGAEPPAPAQDVEAQSARLRELLRQLGPRRDALAKKLGTPAKPLPVPVLLARFRAAGLEREFGQRERDLLRALLKRNRAAFGPVAKELQLSAPALDALIRERGLAREVEAERAAMREKILARGDPRDRVDQVLRQREWLADLGLLERLDREVDALVRPLWARAREAGVRGPRAIESLRRELRVPAADVQALLGRLKLRA